MYKIEKTTYIGKAKTYHSSVTEEVYCIITSDNKYGLTETRPIEGQVQRCARFIGAITEVLLNKGLITPEDLYKFDYDLGAAKFIKES